MAIPERKVVVGNPARMVKDVSDEMLAWKTEGTRLYQELPARLHAGLVPCEPLRDVPTGRQQRQAVYQTWQNGDGRTQPTVAQAKARQGITRRSAEMRLQELRARRVGRRDGEGDRAVQRRDRRTGSARRAPEAWTSGRAGVRAHGRAARSFARMTFHQRARMLKALAQYLTARKEQFYDVSKATGATKTDSWIDIDGGFGTLFAYASRGRREFPDETFYVDGPAEMTLQGRHVRRPPHLRPARRARAIHINAFNFPVWGMLEKMSTALLGGRAVDREAGDRDLVSDRGRGAGDGRVGMLPPGAFQLLCGSAGDLLDHVDCQDAVAFTGSASDGPDAQDRPGDGRAFRAIQSGSGFAQLLDAGARCACRGPRSSISSSRKSFAR